MPKLKKNFWTTSKEMRMRKGWLELVCIFTPWQIRQSDIHLSIYTLQGYATSNIWNELKWVEKETMQKEVKKKKVGIFWYIQSSNQRKTCLSPYLSKSVRRLLSRNPLANGLLSIFNLVICKEKYNSIISFIIWKKENILF